MSVNSNLHFPKAHKMIEFLTHHALLNTAYLQEKGITQAVANLAAKRFANCERAEMGVKLGSILLITDLQAGKDGFTGEALPDLGKLRLPDFFWEQLADMTELALKDCARSCQDNQ